MLCGLIRLVSRIKWWLYSSPNKQCNNFCINCEYFDICKENVTYFDELFPWK